jgi:hypothetical protein
LAFVGSTAIDGICWMLEPDVTVWFGATESVASPTPSSSLTASVVTL